MIIYNNEAKNFKINLLNTDIKYVCTPCYLSFVFHINLLYRGRKQRLSADLRSLSCAKYFRGSKIFHLNTNILYIYIAWIDEESRKKQY